MQVVRPLIDVFVGLAAVAWGNPFNAKDVVFGGSDLLQIAKGARNTNELKTSIANAQKTLSEYLQAPHEFPADTKQALSDLINSQLNSIQLDLSDLASKTAHSNTANLAEHLSKKLYASFDLIGCNEPVCSALEALLNVSSNALINSPKFQAEFSQVSLVALLRGQVQALQQQSEDHAETQEALGKLNRLVSKLTHNTLALWTPSKRSDELDTFSQMTFTQRAVEFVGRDTELKQLREFLDTDQSLCWWQVAGAGGQGKSRLALQLLDELDAYKWHSGFLQGYAIEEINWHTVNFYQDTLIIIDYVTDKDKADCFFNGLIEIGKRLRGEFDANREIKHKIRFLLLEREGFGFSVGNKNLPPSWLNTLNTTQKRELQAYKHNDTALNLHPLTTEQMLAIANTWRNQHTNFQLMTKAEEALLIDTLGGEPKEHSEPDPAWRPLIAILYANLETIENTNTNTTDALEQLLEKTLEEEKRQSWNIEGECKMEAIYLACLATMVGELDLVELKAQLPEGETKIFGLSNISNEEFKEILRQAWCLLGRNVTPDLNTPKLFARTPDLLGEYAVLWMLKPFCGGTLVNPTPSPNIATILSHAWVKHDNAMVDFMFRLQQDFEANAIRQELQSINLNLPKGINQPNFPISCALGMAWRTEHLLTRTDSNDISLGLFFAIELKKIETIKIIANNSTVDINKTDEIIENFPLLFAIESNQLEVVLTLLESPSIDVNKTHKYLGSPLFCAIIKGHLKILRTLLKHPDIDINKSNKDFDFIFPLLLAIQLDHKDIVDLLLQQPHIDVNKIHKGKGLFPLNLATLQGKQETVKKLLEHNLINVNQQDKENGHTALMVSYLGAKRYKHDPEPIVNILLNHGADDSLKDSKGYSVDDYRNLYEVGNRK